MSFHIGKKLKLRFLLHSGLTICQSQYLKIQGKNVCYLYLDHGRRYVGRGILHNDLNDRILHGIPLEEGYVRIQFEVAEKTECNTQLPRPCDEANLVGKAPGYFLAWPRRLVSTKLEVEYIV